MTEQTAILGGKLARKQFCVTQISHKIAWDRTHASTVKDRRLTAWTMLVVVGKVYSGYKHFAYLLFAKKKTSII
jgi:hypothetical protein